MPSGHDKQTFDDNPQQRSESLAWIPVGHDVDEHDLSPLKALAGAIIHADDQKKRTGQEFADEAVSDAASFVEIGKGAVHAFLEQSPAALAESPFAYISATAAVYLLTQIHKDGTKTEGRLINALKLLDEYKRTKDRNVLHKAGLELEQVPNIELNGQTCGRTLSLMKVYEIGDRVAQTDVGTAKKIADRLVQFGQTTSHALKESFVNAYWRNPTGIVGIFKATANALRVSWRLAHIRATGSNEVQHDHKKGLFGGKEPEDRPIDLTRVVLKGIEVENIEDFQPSLLEESLHIDEQYQDLLKDRLKFMHLTVIQGIFIGASIGQGIWNGVHGDPGWAFVNFSSASAASGPFKFFAERYAEIDAILRTHRAETGHRLASLAGRDGASHQSSSNAANEHHTPEI
ncbi:MAG: hypothetical protein IPH06_01195 [Alphaproteobacteria bacterium]|nr:hypothetical protein [Alphaproteobacteria bacterium]